MKQYIVDAFTDRVFGGNPAAVCLLDSWLPDELLMQITRENNLSETAFAVPEGSNYHLRWFTPGGEIVLCGHATLATAYVIFRFAQPERSSVSFRTLGGLLTVERRGELLEMDFPAYSLEQVPVTDEMAEAMNGARPTAAYMGRDLLCVFDSENTVRQMAVDQEKVRALPGLLLHATAKGSDFDCVSRSFAPKCAVPEDPVCGSGHCHMIPYWASVLHKDELVAYQASARGGVLYCRVDGQRIRMAGKAALYAVSELYIEA